MPRNPNNRENSPSREPESARGTSRFKKIGLTLSGLALAGGAIFGAKEALGTSEPSHGQAPDRPTATAAPVPGESYQANDNGFGSVTPADQIELHGDFNHDGTPDTLRGIDTLHDTVEMRADQLHDPKDVARTFVQHMDTLVNLLANEQDPTKRAVLTETYAAALLGTDAYKDENRPIPHDAKANVFYNKQTGEVADAIAFNSTDSEAFELARTIDTTAGPEGEEGIAQSYASADGKTYTVDTYLKDTNAKTGKTYGQTHMWRITIQKQEQPGGTAAWKVLAVGITAADK